MKKAISANVKYICKGFLLKNSSLAFIQEIETVREENKIFFFGRDLTSLARIYQTDKWGRHFYTPAYSHWFSDLRFKPVRLLEISIGGYAKSCMGGNSLRMWKSYFPKGIITGTDIYDKPDLTEPRIHI